MPVSTKSHDFQLVVFNAKYSDDRQGYEESERDNAALTLVSDNIVLNMTALEMYAARSTIKATCMCTGGEVNVGIVRMECPGFSYISMALIDGVKVRYENLHEAFEFGLRSIEQKNLEILELRLQARSALKNLAYALGSGDDHKRIGYCIDIVDSKEEPILDVSQIKVKATNAKVEESFTTGYAEEKGS